MAENIATVNAEGALVDNPKLEQVFLSIEKQLIAQTGFLKSMQSLQTDEFRFNKEMARRAESEKTRSLVAQEDGSNLSSTTPPVAQDTKGKEEAGKGIFGLLSSLFSGLTVGGLAASLLKKSLPALLAPVIGNFIGGAVEQTLKEFGMSDKASKGISDAATSGVTWAIWGKLLFGNKGAILGLLAGIGSKLGTLMTANKDNIVGKIMGGISDDPKVWDEWGMLLVPALTGLLYFIGKKLGIKLLEKGKTAISDALGRNKVPPITPAGGPPVPPLPTPTTAGPGPTPTTAGPGAKPATTAPNAGKVPTYAPGKFSVPGLEGQKPGGATSVNQKMPSGMRTNSAGRVIDSKTDKFQSIDAIMDALKSEGRAATLAKYAKFFKFAGPAMTIIPALIDPAMAIYNDESEQEIKKQIAGALGTIGGAYLGAIAGAAGATMIPVVGQSGIGNLLGGIIGGVGGALSGEFLAESLASALMGGPAPEPVSTEYDPSMPEALPFITSTPSASPVAPSASANVSRAEGRATMLNDPRRAGAPQIAPASSVNNRVDAMANMQGAAAGNSGAGVNVNNNMGGNVNNNTNVGGSSTTYNIFQSSGSAALSNSLPVPMAA